MRLRKDIAWWLAAFPAFATAQSGELLWAYGRSPPVYPSPNATGQGGWASAYAQASALVSQLTLEEKASLSLGSGTTNGCSGFISAIDGVNFTGLCLQDAESGVRGAKLVSAYPAQIHMGASWNRDLAYKRAQLIGHEFKAKGVNVALGPVVGPLGRLAKGGRNWEGFSNDPYLAGELVYPTITGLQESIIACVKHYIANEQETNRQPFFLGYIPGLWNQSVSSNVDDRSMHELYLWPFYDAMRAEPGSVMCSYNRINGSHSCQNSKGLNGLLKTEIGFQGFVVSDWYGAHTGIAANAAGLDMVMPSSQFLSSSSLANAVRNGSLPEARLDDQATRILASWLRYAPLQKPGMDNYASVDARDPTGDQIRFQSAVEGHVLVKNVNNTLPLRSPPVLNLFGFDAIGGSNATSDPLFTWGLANTEHWESGNSFGIIDFDARMAGIVDPSLNYPQIALDGTIMTGGGSGATTPVSSIAPYDALLRQATEDNTTLYTDFKSQLPKVLSPSHPCIVFVNAQSSESQDRSELQNQYTDTLVSHVADSCRSTIVVMHNAGIRLVDRWIDHPNITALIYAHLPGQESGSALVEIMYGRQSPSGRLPYTVAKLESDYGTLLNPAYGTVKNPYYSQSDFTEGVMIDYKHFINQNIEPRFAFGFGLTYSQFNYSNFHASWNQSTSTAQLPPDMSVTPIPQGGHDSLYDIVATAKVDITNVGDVAAAEVAQLYVGIPGSDAPKVLRGFEKLLLQPGENGAASFSLRRKDLSIWDVVQQQWVLNRGSYNLMVGKSVMDIVGTTTLDL